MKQTKAELIKLMIAEGDIIPDRKGRLAVEYDEHGLKRLAALIQSKQDSNYRKALEEIREIYAGMDGFIAETAPEAYQEMIIRKMYECAAKALIQNNQETPETPEIPQFAGTRDQLNNLTIKSK